MNKTITKEEAMELLRNKFPKKVIRSCEEYSTGYVVEVVPKGEEKSNKKFLDAAWFVAKDGSQIVVNKPGFVPINEIKDKENSGDALKALFKKQNVKSFLKHYGIE